MSSPSRKWAIIALVDLSKNEIAYVAAFLMSSGFLTLENTGWPVGSTEKYEDRFEAWATLDHKRYR